MVERKCDLHKILNNFDLIKDNWEKSPCYPSLEQMIRAKKNSKLIHDLILSFILNYF